MRVRIARGEDAPALAGLILGFRDYLGATRPGEEALAAALPAALEDPTLEFGIAFSVEGEAQGYTQCRFFPSVWTCATEGHLEDLFVVASARGRGVGRELMDFAIRRAAARGAAKLGLHTNERNDPAQAFYRKAGFRPQTEATWQGGREVYWARAIGGPRG